MKKVVIIPARLNSSRLPNKVLLDLRGKTVVQRVFEQCKKAQNIDDVYIATDSLEVKENCQKFTKNIIMTKSSHQSGTDRIAEAVANIECDVVVNVQGDEPFIDPVLIEKIANEFANKDVKMASAMHQLKMVDDLKNPNVVKVVIDNQNNALYFSRAMIPYSRDGIKDLMDLSYIPQSLTFYRHLGIYAYTKDFLLTYAMLPESYLEQVEKLEQLRVLENGYKIRMVETEHNSIGIDSIEDYHHALEILDKI